MSPRLRLPMSMLACLIGPALSGVATLALMIGSAMLRRPVPSGAITLSELQQAAGFVGLIVIYAAPAMIAIGLPVQAWMSRRGWTAWWQITPPAALGGGIAMVALMPVSALAGFAFGAWIGGLSGLCAWALRRPDRDRHFDTAAALAAANRLR
jgi:hypothetical protein